MNKQHFKFLLHLKSVKFNHNWVLHTCSLEPLKLVNFDKKQRKKKSYSYVITSYTNSTDYLYMYSTMPLLFKQITCLIIFEKHFYLITF